MKKAFGKIPNWIKRHKKSTAAIGLVMVLVSGITWRFVFAGRNQQAQAIQTQTATTGDIEKTVEGSGSVVSASTQTVTFSNNVTVQSVSKKDGASVSKGDTIAVLSSSDLEDAIAKLESEISTLESTLSNGAESASSTITSKVSGRVKRIYASEGTLVSKTMDSKGALMEIAADGKLKVTFKVSNSAKTGDKVTVKFGSYSISSTIASVKSGRATVRISDSYYYNVDTQATVYNSSGKKIGSGKLKSNSPITVTGSTGTVSSISVSKNQKVYSGTTLMTLTGVGYSDEYQSNLSKHQDLTTQLETLKKERNNLTVTAKYDGVVSGSITKGATISKGQTVCKVVGTSSYEVSIDVDELDIKSVKTGQTAVITADAVEDKKFKGTVSKVSKIGSNEDGVATYPVTIELEDAQDLLPAMSATAVITTEKATGAVLVPVSSIQTKNNESYVTIVTEDKKEGAETKVEVGIINDTYAQITSGVKEGDQVKVITRSSSSEDKQMKNQDGGFGSGAGEGSGQGRGSMPSGGGMPSGSK